MEKISKVWVKVLLIVMVVALGIDLRVILVCICLSIVRICWVDVKDYVFSYCKNFKKDDERLKIVLKGRRKN